MNLDRAALALAIPLLCAGCVAEDHLQPAPVALAQGDDPWLIGTDGTGHGHLTLEPADAMDVALMVQVGERLTTAHEMSGVMHDGDLLMVVVLAPDEARPLYELVLAGTAHGVVGLDETPPLQFRLERPSALLAYSSLPGLRIGLLDHAPNGLEMVPRVRHRTLTLDARPAPFLVPQVEDAPTEPSGHRRTWNATASGSLYVAAIGWTLHQAPSFFQGSDAITLGLDGRMRSAPVPSEAAWLGNDELASISLTGLSTSNVGVGRVRETTLPSMDPATGMTVVAVPVDP